MAGIVTKSRDLTAPADRGALSTLVDPLLAPGASRLASVDCSGASLRSLVFPACCCRLDVALSASSLSTVNGRKRFLNLEALDHNPPVASFLFTSLCCSGRRF